MSMSWSQFLNSGKPQSQIVSYPPSWLLQQLPSQQLNNNNPQIKFDDIIQPKLSNFTEYLPIVFKIHNQLRQIDKKDQLNIYNQNINKIQAQEFNKIPLQFANKSDFLKYQFKYIYTDQFYKIICQAISDQEGMEQKLIIGIQELKENKYDLKQEIKMISQLMKDILQKNE